MIKKVRRRDIRRKRDKRNCMRHRSEAILHFQSHSSLQMAASNRHGEKPSSYISGMLTDQPLADNNDKLGGAGGVEGGGGEEGEGWRKTTNYLRAKKTGQKQ